MGLKRLPEEKDLTPSEIAVAIAAVETRRTGDTQRNPSATLAEVLHQINPDLSPEEVRAEIATQRMLSAESRRRTRRVRAAFAAVAATLIMGSMVVSQSTSAPEQSLPAFSLTWQEVQQRILVQDTEQNRPIARTLAEVPDGRTVRVTASAIDASVMDEIPRTEGAGSEPVWHVDNDAPEMTWHVFKLDHHLYVRGWTRERLSVAASKLGPVEVYNTPTAPGLGSHPIQISVRLTPGSEFCAFSSNAYIHPRGQTWERFSFSNIQSDEHTWEAW